MMGIQMTLTTTKKRTKRRPAIRSSFSVADLLFGPGIRPVIEYEFSSFEFWANLMRVYMSMVKIVDDELKIEVRDDISAANMTANIRPRRPAGKSSFTNFTKAMLVQPDLDEMIGF